MAFEVRFNVAGARVGKVEGRTFLSKTEVPPIFVTCKQPVSMAKGLQPLGCCLSMPIPVMLYPESSS